MEQEEHLAHKPDPGEPPSLAVGHPFMVTAAPPHPSIASSQQPTAMALLSNDDTASLPLAVAETPSTISLLLVDCLLEPPPPHPLRLLFDISKQRRDPPSVYTRSQEKKVLHASGFGKGFTPLEPRPSEVYGTQPEPIWTLVSLTDIEAFQARTTLARKNGFVRPKADALPKDLRMPEPCWARPNATNGNRPVLYRFLDASGDGRYALEAVHFELFLPHRPDLRMIFADEHTKNAAAGYQARINFASMARGDFVWVYDVGLAEEGAAKLPMPDINAVCWEQKADIIWAASLVALAEMHPLEVEVMFLKNSGCFSSVRKLFGGDREREQDVHGVIAGWMKGVDIPARKYFVLGEPISEALYHHGDVEEASILQSNIQETPAVGSIVGAAFRQGEAAFLFTVEPLLPEHRVAYARAIAAVLPAFHETGPHPAFIFKLPKSIEQQIVDRETGFHGFYEDRETAMEILLRLSSLGGSCRSVDVREKGKQMTTGEVTKLERHPGQLGRATILLQESSPYSIWDEDPMVVLSDSDFRNKVKLLRLESGGVLHVAMRNDIFARLEQLRTDSKSKRKKFIVTVSIICRNSAYDSLVAAIQATRTNPEGLCRSLLSPLIYSRRLPKAVPLPPAQSPIFLKHKCGGTDILLNVTQSTVVEAWKNGAPFLAVQGAFRTGKSLVAAAMAQSSVPDGLCILTSAQNTAVSVLLEMCMSFGVSEMRPMRIVARDSYHKLPLEDQTEYDAPAMISRILDFLPDSASDEERIVAQRYLDAVDDLIPYTSTDVDPASRLETRYFKQDDRDAVRLYYNEVMPLLLKYYKPNVVLLTVDRLLTDVCSSTQMENPLRLFLGSADSLIVDDASQLQEGALLCLINALPDARLALIGDKQALLTFCFDECKREHLLVAQPALSVALKLGKCPSAYFNEVYGMPPELMELPARLYYDEEYERVDGSYALLMRNPLICRFSGPRANPLLRAGLVAEGDVPFVFITYDGEPLLEKHSYSCEREYKAVKAVVDRLLKGAIPQDNITIISFYEAQRKKLARLGVAVSTVDAFQGRADGVVIVASTNHRSGFTSDPGRMNVALTRATQGIIILGWKHDCDLDWKEAAQHAEENGRRYDAVEFLLGTMPVPLRRI